MQYYSFQRFQELFEATMYEEYGKGDVGKYSKR
jgi:hypothetical protein